MGILAIVFLVAYFIWKCIHNSQEGWRAGGLAMKARENGQRWYYTHEGTFRADDNRKVHVTKDWNTCSWIETDLKTFEKTNLSAYVRGVLEKTAREKGFPTVVKADDYNRYDTEKMQSCCARLGQEFFGPKASRYRDLKTGKLYVVVNHNWCSYFLDTKTWKIVRPTDDQMRIEERAKEEGRLYHDKAYFDEEIGRYNMEQEKAEASAHNSIGLYLHGRNIQPIWEWYDHTYYLPSIDGLIGLELRSKGLVRNSSQMIEDAVSKRPLMEQKETQSNEED